MFLCGHFINVYLLPSALVVVDGKPVRLQLCDVSGEVGLLVFIPILSYFNHN